jgi:hypothetical protein
MPEPSEQEAQDEYEIQAQRGWSRDTLAYLALGFLRTAGPLREGWLAHLRAVAKEEDGYSEGWW